MTAEVRREPHPALRALPASLRTLPDSLGLTRDARLPVLLTTLAFRAGVGYHLGLLLSDAPPTNSAEATMGLAALHISGLRQDWGPAADQQRGARPLDFMSWQSPRRRSRSASG